LREYAKLVLDGDKYKEARKYFVVLGLSSFAISIVHHDLILHSFIMSTLLLFVVFLFLAKDETLTLQEIVNKTGLSILGILYAGVCPVYLCLLAQIPPRPNWLIFTLCLIFAGDIAAYFFGIRFGKTKLFSRISPNKSIEGSIASLFASVFVGMIFRYFWLPNTDIFLMLCLFIMTSIVAQLGDLCESLIKRSFNAKDSGSIMPGHGGLLDRLDGVLFGAPMIYIFAKYIVLI
jgi:phosphatidate cytidylyltransferase